MDNNIGVNKEMTAEDIAHAAFDVLDEKKGHNLRVLYVAEQTVLTEYYVLCTGNSSTHIQSLAGEVEFKLNELGAKTFHFEGRDNNSWIVVDFGTVIVHVFSKEARSFYALDKLYSDAKEIKYQSIDDRFQSEKAEGDQR